MRVERRSRGGRPRPRNRLSAAERGINHRQERNGRCERMIIRECLDSPGDSGNIRDPDLLYRERMNSEARPSAGHLTKKLSARRVWGSCMAHAIARSSAALRSASGQRSRDTLRSSSLIHGSNRAQRIARAPSARPTASNAAMRTSCHFSGSAPIVGADALKKRQCLRGPAGQEQPLGNLGGCAWLSPCVGLDPGDETVDIALRINDIP